MYGNSLYAWLLDSRLLSRFLDYLDYLEFNVGDNSMECLWVRIRGKARRADIIVGVCYRPPNQGEEAHKMSCKQLGEVSLRALVLMGDLNLPNDFWKYKTAVRRQSRRFLVCGRYFLTQLMSYMRGDVPLELPSNGVLAAHLSDSNCEMWVFNSHKTLEEPQQKGHLGLLDRHWLDKVERVLLEMVLKGKGVQGGWKCPKGGNITGKE